MFENRISELFRFTRAPNASTDAMSAATAAQFMPFVSLADIYQAASNRARHEFELDKLFNPEYYGDGSGI